MTEERSNATDAMQLYLGIYCLAVLVAFAAILIILLPPDGRALGFGWQLALLVAAAGGLGASIHTATSFSHHAGVGTLGPRWTWWFILRPALGAGLGVLFAFTVTGLRVNDVLKDVPADDATRRLISYLALSGLAGMFSRQAIDWLRGVFDGLFRAPEADEEADKKSRLERLGDKSRSQDTTPDAKPSEGVRETRKDDAPETGTQEKSDTPRDGGEKRRPSQEPSPGADGSGRPWSILVPVYIGGMIILLAATIALACTVSRWLAAPPAAMECVVSALVAAAAALGATIHVFTSIADFAGRRQLGRQWLWWYILRPFIAAALGLLVYFGVRAMWIPKLETAAHLYGVLVVALLAGTFSKQTIRWLSELYDAAFRKVDRLEKADEQPPQSKG